MRFWSNFMNGVKAFREAFVTSEALDPENFVDFDARRLRYEIFWSFYQNDAYRLIHNWAVSYKTGYALYKYLRNLYNPSYRIGEFYKAHLWGGQIDYEADEEGALPIVTDNDRIRAPIADVWRWSNWQTRKDVVALQGAIFGDAIARVVDNPMKERVYFEILHPGVIKDLTVDDFDNIQAYVIEEERADPRNVDRSVTYVETCVKTGSGILYRTYLNGKLFAWDGEAYEWVVPYDFVPMIHIKHNDVGLDWGWSELHPQRSKIHELDDLASLLSDQIRKTINVKWLFAGVQAPSSSPSTENDYATTQYRPEPGREAEQALYGSADARATALVAPLDLAGVNAHIQAIQEELEKDYPELKFDNLRSQGTVSGASLRIARQPAETKVQQRRANYDAALVKLNQMAISIGAIQGYPGFDGFSETSYDDGELKHRIGDRPIFQMTDIDKYEEDKIFWEAAKSAKDAGMPLELYLEFAGWTKERLEMVKNALQERRETSLRISGGQVGNTQNPQDGGQGQGPPVSPANQYSPQG